MFGADFHMLAFQEMSSILLSLHLAAKFIWHVSMQTLPFSSTTAMPVYSNADSAFLKYWNLDMFTSFFNYLVILDCSERYGFAVGAPGWKPGKHHLSHNSPGHRSPASPLHEGPQWQQHQAHHPENRSPDPLPWPQQPAEKIHSLHSGHYWISLSGTAVPHGVYLVCVWFNGICSLKGMTLNY